MDVVALVPDGADRAEDGVGREVPVPAQALPPLTMLGTRCPTVVPVSIPPKGVFTKFSPVLSLLAWTGNGSLLSLLQPQWPCSPTPPLPQGLCTCCSQAGLCMVAQIQMPPLRQSFLTACCDQLTSFCPAGMT